MKNILTVLVIVLMLFSCVEPVNSYKKLVNNFKNPPEKFKPMPFWHINGEHTRDGIRKQMKDAKE